MKKKLHIGCGWNKLEKFYQHKNFGHISKTCLISLGKQLKLSDRE